MSPAIATYTYMGYICIHAPSFAARSVAVFTFVVVRAHIYICHARTSLLVCTHVMRTYAVHACTWHVRTSSLVCKYIPTSSELVCTNFGFAWPTTQQSALRAHDAMQARACTWSQIEFCCSCQKITEPAEGIEGPSIMFPLIVTVCHAAKLSYKFTVQCMHACGMQ